LSVIGKQRSVSNVRNNSARARENTMQTFDTPAPVSAVLDIPAGRIQLIAADRDDTTVDIRPADPARKRDVKAAEQATVTCTDGVLRITSPTGHQHLGPTGSLDLTVQLPAGSRIEATTAACELRTVGRLGDVTFTGAYHRIKLDETAALHLTATDGDIAIGRLDGPADISTARGDITITEAAQGTLHLRTHAGDITVTAAPGTSATLDAGTSNGRVTNTLKNNGTTALHIHATTSTGDITARSL
jgi:Putative adhesin